MVNQIVLTQTKKKRFNEQKLKKNIFVFIALLVPVLNFLVFWLYVNFKSIMFSFMGTTESGEIFYGFHNFKQAFLLIRTDPRMIHAIKNTLVTWVFSNVFLFPLSICISFFMYKRIFFTSGFRLIFYLPQIISVSALSTVFIYMLQDKAPIGELYKLITGSTTVPSFLRLEEYAMGTVYLYMFWTQFCGSLLFLSGVMSRIPREMMESALMDGCGMFREFFNFVIPLCWPVLATFVVSALTGLFTASGPILMLTGGMANTYTLDYWIFDQVRFQNTYFLPAAVGMIFTLIGLPIVLVSRWALNKFIPVVEY